MVQSGLKIKYSSSFGTMLISRAIKILGVGAWVVDWFLARASCKKMSLPSPRCRAIVGQACTMWNCKPFDVYTKTAIQTTKMDDTQWTKISELRFLASIRPLEQRAHNPGLLLI